MTGDAAVVGLVVGVVVAAIVVLSVHLRRRRAGADAAPDRRGGGQGARGIPADPGQSRPAGPDAEAQGPDRTGNMGAPEEGGASERE